MIRSSLTLTQNMPGQLKRLLSAFPDVLHLLVDSRHSPPYYNRLDVNVADNLPVVLAPLVASNYWPNAGNNSEDPLQRLVEDGAMGVEPLTVKQQERDNKERPKNKNQISNKRDATNESNDNNWPNGRESIDMTTTAADAGENQSRELNQCEHLVLVDDYHNLENRMNPSNHELLLSQLWGARDIFVKTLRTFKRSPLHFHLLLVAAVFVSLAIYCIPVIEHQQQEQQQKHALHHDHLSPSSVFVTTIEPRESDAISSSNWGPDTNHQFDNTSIWTWQTAPYILLSLGYLLLSLSTTFNSFETCRYRDFEPLPFQCCLAVGNALLALISLTLPQTDILEEPKSNDLLGIEAFLYPSYPSSSSSSLPSRPEYHHHPWDAVNVGNCIVTVAGVELAAVLLGGACRAASGLSLFQLAKRRQECRHNLAINFMTTVGGIMFTAASLLLLFRLTESGDENRHRQQTVVVVVMYNASAILHGHNSLFGQFCSYHQSLAAAL